ncbi:hypothetical protein BH11ARM1_BH11ARM1_10610 [soil metagenome]
MSEFGQTWELVRKRFDDVFEGLNQEQLSWRLHPGTLTLGESAIHVAGVEISFISQLLGSELSLADQRLKLAATDGVVNHNTFPFRADEITPKLVQDSLSRARTMVEGVIGDPTDEVRHAQIKSALGPIIDGNGAFARLAYHPGYHHGQAHIIKTAPGFPE